MTPAKVPPGASKSFKRFMKCELCHKDNDVLNPLIMGNPTGKPPPTTEEHMKNMMKASETMDAQSMPPGYAGAPNKPWNKPAGEMAGNHGQGIKFCPDDWLDLGLGDHLQPIDPHNPPGHKCKNLLNIGKCKTPTDALISDLAVEQGLDGPRGEFVEDFTKKKYKGWFGKYYKCMFARECRAPWKGFDNLCGVSRWWLKQTEDNAWHRFLDAPSDENPVKWPGD